MKLYNIYCGHDDKNGKHIYYETSILLLPDRRQGVLKFDVGQLNTYFARKTGEVYIDLDGVNNCHSFYLSDCEIIHQIMVGV